MVHWIQAENYNLNPDISILAFENTTFLFERQTQAD